MSIFEAVDLYDFLSLFIKSTKNVTEITILNKDGKIEASSVVDKTGRDVGKEFAWPRREFVSENGKQTYLVVTQITPDSADSKLLMLYIDATTYTQNVRALVISSLATCFLTILFSLAMAYSVNRINHEKAESEKAALEGAADSVATICSDLDSSIKRITGQIQQQSDGVEKISSVTRETFDVSVQISSTSSTLAELSVNLKKNLKKS